MPWRVVLPAGRPFGSVVRLVLLVSSAARKLELMDALAVAFGRPIDLVDLRTAPVPVLHQALTTGICISKKDKDLYAELLRKLWYDRADIMPNYELILQARRRRFVDE